MNNTLPPRSPQNLLSLQPFFFHWKHLSLSFQRLKLKLWTQPWFLLLFHTLLTIPLNCIHNPTPSYQVHWPPRSEAMLFLNCNILLIGLSASILGPTWATSMAHSQHFSQNNFSNLIQNRTFLCSTLQALCISLKRNAKSLQEPNGSYMPPPPPNTSSPTNVSPADSTPSHTRLCCTHTRDASTLRSLLQLFSLPGMLFPQIGAWLTPSGLCSNVIDSLRPMLTTLTHTASQPPTPSLPLNPLTLLYLSLLHSTH